MARIRILLLFFVCSACPFPGAAAVDLIRDEKLILEILRHGELNLSGELARVMPPGTSERRIRRIGLEKDGHLIRAAFRDKAVKISVKGTNVPPYRDTYYNELAAYLVAKYLGLNVIPPTVLRSIPISASGLKASKDLREGTLQLWVENSVVEFDLIKEEIPYPGEAVLRNRQMKEILALDCIIGNVDRHAGNLLVDLNERFEISPDTAEAREPFLGKIWAIDHSRAFHRRSRLEQRYCRLKVLKAKAISLSFIQGLRSWNSEEVSEILRSSGLSEEQMDHLNLRAMDRRAQLLREHFDTLQKKSGLPDEEFYSSGIWNRVW